MEPTLRWLQEGVRSLAEETTNYTAALGVNTTTEGMADIDEGITEESSSSSAYAASKVALVLPRVTAMISLLAVAAVASEAWQDLRADRKSSMVRGNRIRSSTITSSFVSTITRIQLFYQIPLFCHALAFALGTTPAPSNQGIWGAAGNIASCEAQGFLMQFGVFGCIGWDCALSTAYLIMVRYNNVAGWVTRYHFIIWPVTLILCIYPLVKDMYNFNHGICWVESVPNVCTGDECIRGAGAALWQNLASFAAAIHLVYSTSVMVVLYCSIRGLENNRTGQTTTSSSSSTTASPSRHASKAVGIQGMLYASGMIVTTLPTCLYIVLTNMAGLSSPGFGIFSLSLIPLIGYVNFLIFFRGRKVTDCRTTYGKLLRRAHWWLFDYQLECMCQCRCIPSYTEKIAATLKGTAPTTQHKSDQNRNSDTTHFGTRVSAAPHQHTPQTQEGDAPDTENEGSGFLIIAVREGSKRISQFVSELGESLSSSERFDNPPSQPMRLQSEVEGPPTKPTRAVSVVESEKDEGTPSNGNKKSNAPVMPVRLESCVLESIAEAPVHDKKSSMTPPVKPQTCVSEFEVPEPDTGRGIPLESIAEVSAEGRDSMPPTKPLRFVSELEEPDPIDQSEIAFEPVGEASVKPRGSLPPAKPQRCTSEFEEPEPEYGSGIARRGSPPVKPVRLVSEIETPSDLEAPPEKPMRYESEIEDPALVQLAKPSPASTPPIQPVRFNSEIHDMDTSNMGSFEGSIRRRSSLLSSASDLPIHDLQTSNLSRSSSGDTAKRKGRNRPESLSLFRPTQRFVSYE